MGAYFIQHALFRMMGVALAVAWLVLPGRAAETDYVVIPFAGAASTGSSDGSGSAARFNFPLGLTVDPEGNVLVADTGNRTIRRISPAGQVTTLAGVVGTSEMLNGPAATARFNWPTDVARDTAGNLHVADRLMVRTITPGGTVSTLAGWPFIPHVNPPPLFTGTLGLTTDTAGNVYVAAFIGTTGNGLARIAPDGKVSTLLQRSTVWPGGVALDAAGQVFCSFFGSGFSEGIARLSASGEPTTFAGGGLAGSVDGTGPAARFNAPLGIQFAPDGNLLVADSDNNLIRVVSPAGQVGTLAGTPPPPGPNPGWSEGVMVDGMGSAARFWNPADVATDAAGNVFVADTNNNAIRKVTPAGATTTLAGLYPASRGRIDGLGGAARFSAPQGIATGPAGELYVADTDNRLIRRIDPSGAVTTFATLASTGVPLWVAADIAGNVYVCDSDNLVFRITREGTASKLAGAFVGAGGLAVDPAGNVFVADPVASVIRRITPDGSVSTLSLTSDGSGGGVLLRTPLGVALDRAGNLYVLNRGSSPQGENYVQGPAAYVSRITPAGVVSVFAGEPGGVLRGAPGDLTTETPRGIAVDAAGNVYVTAGVLGGRDAQQKIYQITPAGELRALTLTPDTGSSHGLFGALVGVACDALGALYVTDRDFTFNRVSKIVPAGARPEITTQPQSRTVAAGGTAQFSVVATGTPGPIYQWYFNQTAISGATGSAFTVSGVQAQDAGDYTVVVKNAWGEVISAKATLTLAATTPPPASGAGSSGGGGAPSAWFGLALLGLAVSRLRHRRGSRLIG